VTFVSYATSISVDKYTAENVSFLSGSAISNICGFGFAQKNI
jgi:hypothetical protein